MNTNSNLTEAQRLERNKRAREWRTAHRDHVEARRRELHKADPERRHEQQRKWHAKHPSKARDYNLRRYYGLNLDRFNEMYMAQDGRCAACNEPMEGRKACVDHCHATGRVRGLLCGKCNSAAGFLDDDAVKAQGLADYLTMA